VKKALVRVGEAIAYGAATIVNAIATGKGAAFSLKLWTKAKVELTEKPGKISVKIVSDPWEKPNLAIESVRTVLEKFKLTKRYGAKVRTESNIPVARGLKSSSVAANAVTLATLSALNIKLKDLEVVKLGVEAAKKAGVTITGAFDDACASYFGGITITDNYKQKILKTNRLPEEYSAVILVPEEKVYTSESELEKVKLLASTVEVAFNEALKGNYWRAMTLNGIIYSAAYGYDVKPVLDALKAGAVAAGLSGKGPAIVAVTPDGKAEKVAEALEAYEGKILKTPLNNDKAGFKI
jgi:shikimate kinase